MVRKGADRNELKNKLKVVNASEMELDVARKAEVTKKDQLTAIEEQVKLQESLIKQLVELAQAQKQAAGGAGAMEDLETALEGVADAFEAIDLSGFKIDFTKLLIDARKQFNDQIGGIADSWNNIWINAFGPGSELQKAWARLLPIIQPYIDQAKAAWDKFASAIGLPSIKDIMDAWTNVPLKTTLVPSLTPLAGPQGVNLPGGMAPTAQDILNPSMQTVKTTDWAGKIQAVLQKFSEDIKANSGIKNTIKEIVAYLWTSLKENLVAIFSDPKNQQAVKDAFNNFMTWVTNLMLGIEPGMGGPGAERAKGQPTPWQTRIGNAIVDGIKTAVSNYVSSIDWGEVIVAAITKEPKVSFRIMTFPIRIGTEIGGYLLMGIWEGIKKGIIWIGTKTGELLVLFLGWLNNVFKSGSPAQTIEPVGKSIVEGMYKGIVDAISNLWYIVAGGLATFINKIKDYFGIGIQTFQNSPLYQIGISIIDGIKQGVLAGYNSLRNLLSKIGINLPEIVAEATGSQSPSKLFAHVGRDLMLGLEKGITDTSGVVRKALNGTVGNYTVRNSMNAPMSAPPVYGGTTVTFGDVNLSGNMDFAVFKAMFDKYIAGG
jgi:hypothetical protein